jgi:hypothetical protein
MSLQRQSSAQSSGRALVRWCLRCLLPVLFVSHVVHLSTHLPGDAHYDLWHAAAQFSGVAQTSTCPEDDHHESDSHPPHSMTDHLVLRSHRLVLADPGFDLPVPEATVLAAVLMAHCVLPWDRFGPTPGESPPDPRRSRAPPLV